MLLKKHKGNFKAVYQRARAHAALCQEDEARRDFAMVEKLDPKFRPIVRQELKRLGENMRTMHSRQNKSYREATQEKWGSEGSKAKAAVAAKARSQNNVKITQIQTEAVTRDQMTIAQDDGEVKTEDVEENIVKLADEKIESKCGRVEGLDNRTSVVEDAADNEDTNKDSDPVPTSEGDDSVESNRPACDKATEKGKCQSSPALEPGSASEGNKESGADNTGDGGGTPSKQSKERELEAMTREE